MTCRALALAMTAAIAWGAGVARADTLRVLVLVGGERDRQAAARVEGQIADLDVAITTASAALEPDLVGQVASARARAAAWGADAVVWFGADGDDWMVYAARGEQVLARRVGGASGAISDSASIEAVALAVRTAVQGLSTVGERAAGDPPAPRVPAPGAALRPWGELGWDGVLDGQGSAGRHGIAARLGAASGRWRAAAAVSYHPAATLGSAQATIAVERQTAGLVVGVDLLEASGRWRIGVELGAAAARFPRATTAAGAGLTPTTAGSPWTPVLSPAARVTRRLAAAAWLAFSVGADLLLRRPEFGVAGPNGFERLAVLWPVEPKATLSLVIDPS